MTKKRLDEARNADLRGTLPALLRAARRAREIAAQTGTALVVVRDGVIEHVVPQPDDTADGAPESTVAGARKE